MEGERVGEAQEGITTIKNVTVYHTAKPLALSEKLLFIYTGRTSRQIRFITYKYKQLTRTLFLVKQLPLTVLPK